MRPSSIVLTLIPFLLWIAAPGASAIAQGLYVDNVVHLGGSIPKTETTWQILPLANVDQYLVCVFGTNSQDKKCKASVSARGYLANRGAPLTAFQVHGGFSSTLRLKSGDAGSAFDQSCFISPPGAGADYLVMRFDWKWKTCRRLSSRFEGMLGAASERWLEGSSTRLDLDGAAPGRDQPLVWRPVRR